MRKRHYKSSIKDNSQNEETEENNNYDIVQEPIVISKITSDIFLKQDRPADLMALYWFYYYTAKWQRTNKTKATTSYAAKGLKWSEDKIRRTKKQLIKLGLIEDIRGKRSKLGEFGKCYIYVKFIWWDKEKLNKFNSNDPPGFTQCGGTDSLANPEGNALSTINKNTLSTINKNALNIYTLFLEKWKKYNLSKSILKITSKRKKHIDKALKDYTQEEIFKAFQNYATVLNSPDYFWNYKWTIEDFLQRGLHKFIDEVDPLKTYKNNNSFQNNQLPQQQSQTKESLNLFSYEAQYLDEWIKIYSDLTNDLINADIWPHSYQPNKDKIFSALIELKSWVNNLIYGNNYSKIKRVAGSLGTICKEYIEWIEEQEWLEEGIKEGSLFPNSEMFKNNFMPALEDKIMDIPIRSRGWKNDNDFKMQTPDEIEEQEKQNEIDNEKRKQERERNKKDNEWAYSCIKKHFLDLEKTDISKFNISNWIEKGSNWRQDFEKFIIDIEKRHQKNKSDRRFSYLFLFKK